MKDMLNKPIIDRFFKDQLMNWEVAKSGYDLLKNVQERTILIDDFPFRVQFNAARALSSSAKIDDLSIKQRPCFLCKANRSAEQGCLRYEYGEEGYDLLINPYPIFPRHFTVASDKHKEQMLGNNFGAILDLAFRIPEYTVLYNGADCGASAPDHFHLQLGNRGFLPIEKEFDLLDMAPFYKDDFTILSYSKGAYKGLIMMECVCMEEAERVFYSILRSLDVKEGMLEPSINLICWFDIVKWRVAIFLRNQHRPYQYYAPDSSRLLISPGAVDMGGVIITPLERDFKRLKREDIQSVMEQVYISSADADLFIRKIAENLWVGYE